ncbi:hypothetical protein CR513_27788, partial [Mucuna pruriens]
MTSKDPKASFIKWYQEHVKSALSRHLLLKKKTIQPYQPNSIHICVKALQCYLEVCEGLVSPWDLIKGKIPPFFGNGSADDYYSWELKVEQNLDCINCEDLIKVKLITLSFEGYAFIWWNEIAL